MLVKSRSETCKTFLSGNVVSWRLKRRLWVVVDRWRSNWYGTWFGFVITRLKSVSSAESTSSATVGMPKSYSPERTPLVTVACRRWRSAAEANSHQALAAHKNFCDDDRPVDVLKSFGKTFMYKPYTPHGPRGVHGLCTAVNNTVDVFAYWQLTVYCSPEAKHSFGRITEILYGAK